MWLFNLNKQLLSYIIAKNKLQKGVMVFNATFSNISVISWRSVFLMAKTKVPGETTNLSQVTNKLYHIITVKELRLKMLCQDPAMSVQHD
jgi:hypothetical protein